MRHYRRRTEGAYAGWIRRYIVFHGKRHPAELGAEEVSRFLSALAVERKVSASTQNQALAALLFLYRNVLGLELPWLDEMVRAARPHRLPVVLSRDERRPRAAPRRPPADGGPTLRGRPPPPRVRPAAGGGRRLRGQPPRRTERKGRPGRVTLLPMAVRPALARHLERIREQHDRDLRAGAGWVALPDALDRKYPNAGREWAWQWVFPATRIYTDPETRQRRRHHLHGLTSDLSSGPHKPMPRWRATSLATKSRGVSRTGGTTILFLRR
jgi:hypothetical protein